MFDLLERAIGVSEALTGDGLLTGEVPATTDDSLFGDEPAAEDGSAVAPATDPVIDLSADADGAPTDPVAVE